MVHPVARWFWVVVFLAGLGTASAHSGYENETAVRLHADRMDVVVRTTFGFAWKILGHRAPGDIGEAAQQIAKPLLTAEAPGLFEVTAGGTAMAPRSTDCVFELDEHVVFLLTYERPQAWPLVLKARFFDFFDPMTYGDIALFDQTDDPYRRDVEPVAADKIYRGKPAFTHDPALAAKVETVPAAVPAAPRPETVKPPGYRGFVIAALLFGLVWWLRRLHIKRPAN